ncbi:MAG: hypothetical protein WCP85_13000 [Mariniphaga sp.]
MKIRTVTFLILLITTIQALAQDQDTLRLENIKRQVSGIEFPKLQMGQELKTGPVLFQDLDVQPNLRPFVLPTMNFKPISGWKVDFRTGFMTGNPMEINTKGFFRLNGWNNYYGYYASKSYQVNNKLFMGTAAFSDRYFNPYAPIPGWSNQTNYGSSLFFGYKFSEKFSIHASFTIQQNGDPWNLNH